MAWSWSVRQTGVAVSALFLSDLIVLLVNLSTHTPPSRAFQPWWTGSLSLLSMSSSRNVGKRKVPVHIVRLSSKLTGRKGCVCIALHSTANKISKKKITPETNKQTNKSFKNNKQSHHVITRLNTSGITKHEESFETWNVWMGLISLFSHTLKRTHIRPRGTTLTKV